jgi:hypothetical protein
MTTDTGVLQRPLERRIRFTARVRTRMTGGESNEQHSHLDRPTLGWYDDRGNHRRFWLGVQAAP